MLFKKMLREIKLFRSQFISIFIMSLLGVLIYAGMNAEYMGMINGSDALYESCKLPDLWLYGKDFTKADINLVKNIEGVSLVTRRSSIDVIAQQDNAPTLRLLIPEDNNLSRIYKISGAPYDSKRDGIWLDQAFAKAHDLQVGDSLAFTLGDQDITKSILGLVMHPEFVHDVKDDGNLMPDHEAFGFAVMPSQVFSPEGMTYNQLLLSIEPDADIRRIKNALEDMFADRFLVLLTRDEQPSVAVFDNEIEQNKTMGNVFPIIFFAIAALSMLTTMIRIVANSRTQIGILKALGYRKGRILFHYTSYGIFISLISGFIGLIAGPLIIPPIMYTMQKSMYTLPEWNTKVSSSSYLILFLCVLICASCAFLAAGRMLNEVPASSLRPVPPKASKHSAIEKSLLWKGLSFTIQWNLRDILRSKIRSLITILGVLGSIALFLFGFGLKDTIGSLNQWMYGELYTFQNRINLSSDIQETDIEALKEKYGGQLIQESTIELKALDQKVNALLTVAEDGTAIHYQNKSLASIALPEDSTGISYKMAKTLGVSVGDSVSWRIYGQKDWQSATIGFIYRTPVGQGILMQADFYTKNYSRFLPTALLTDAARIDTGLPGVISAQHIDQLKASFDDMLASTNLIIGIIILAAIILGCVVLFNLESLSFQERIRELATMQVLGFLPKQIKKLLQIQTLILTILGIIFGIPAGFLMIDYMLGSMPDSNDMVRYVSLPTILLSVVFTLSISFLVNRITLRKLAKIEMVSALKSVE